MVRSDAEPSATNFTAPIWSHSSPNPVRMPAIFKPRKRSELTRGKEVHAEPHLAGAVGILVGDEVVGVAAGLVDGSESARGHVLGDERDARLPLGSACFRAE